MGFLNALLKNDFLPNQYPEFGGSGINEFLLSSVSKLAANRLISKVSFDPDTRLCNLDLTVFKRKKSDCIREFGGDEILFCGHLLNHPSILILQKLHQN